MAREFARRGRVEDPEARFDVGAHQRGPARHDPALREDPGGLRRGRLDFMLLPAAAGKVHQRQPQDERRLRLQGLGRQEQEQEQGQNQAHVRNRTGIV